MQVLGWQMTLTPHVDIDICIHRSCPHPSPSGRLSKFGFDRYWVLFLCSPWWWGSSRSSTQFIRFCRRKHSALSEKWGLNRPAGKAELALNWCGYTAGSTPLGCHSACDITMDGSPMEGIMWLLINIRSKLHHVPLMRLPFSSGVCFPEIGKISHSRTYNACTYSKHKHSSDMGGKVMTWNLLKASHRHVKCQQQLSRCWWTWKLLKN